MFKKLLISGVVLALIVVVLGAYTRLGDAGLGCPDWPGCYGQLTVPDAADGTTIEGYERPLEAEKGWKEMVHRYAASTLGLVILIIFFLSLKGKTQQQQTIALPGFLVLIVILQGALGMWTVTNLVHPGIVSMHLVGGFITTSLLVWLLLNQSNPPLFYKHVLKRHKIFIIFALIVLSLQIILGGWTSTNYAALACGDNFPSCLGQWWPTMDFGSALYWGPLGVDYEYGVLEGSARTAIQIMHRIGALIALTTIFFLLYQLKKYKHISINLITIGLLLFVQITLGILNVVFSLPMAVAVLHNAVALLLLLSMVALMHKVFKP